MHFNAIMLVGEHYRCLLLWLSCFGSPYGNQFVTSSNMSPNVTILNRNSFGDFFMAGDI